MLSVRFAVFATTIALASACDHGLAGPTCDITPECQHPKGTTCEYYKECLPTPCKITTNVAYAMCEKYHDLEASLSPQGLSWSQYVRPCIQQKLTDNVLLKSGSKYTCDEVESTFFNDHLPCYLDNPAGSFCDLPLTDRAKVVWTAKSMIGSGFTRQSVAAGVELMAACGMRGDDMDFPNPGFDMDEIAFDPWKSNSDDSDRAMSPLQGISLQAFANVFVDIVHQHGDWEVAVVAVDVNPNDYFQRYAVVYAESLVSSLPTPADTATWVQQALQQLAVTVTTTNEKRVASFSINHQPLVNVLMMNKATTTRASHAPSPWHVAGLTVGAVAAVVGVVCGAVWIHTRRA